MKRLALAPPTKEEFRIAALVLPEKGYWRPTTRRDCVEVPRPCPYVGCRYNTYIALTPSQFRVPAEEPWQVDPATSCVLDVTQAHPDGMTLEEVGTLMGITRERVRQLESKALVKLQARKEEWTQ